MMWVLPASSLCFFPSYIWGCLLVPPSSCPQPLLSFHLASPEPGAESPLCADEVMALGAKQPKHKPEPPACRGGQSHVGLGWRVSRAGTSRRAGSGSGKASGGGWRVVGGRWEGGTVRRVPFCLRLTGKIKVRSHRHRQGLSLALPAPSTASSREPARVQMCNRKGKAGASPLRPRFSSQSCESPGRGG